MSQIDDEDAGYTSPKFTYPQKFERSNKFGFSGNLPMTATNEPSKERISLKTITPNYSPFKTNFDAPLQFDSFLAQTPNKASQSESKVDFDTN